MSRVGVESRYAHYLARQCACARKTRGTLHDETLNFERGRSSIGDRNSVWRVEMAEGPAPKRRKESEELDEQVGRLATLRRV